jgi:hypothetical protein
LAGAVQQLDTKIENLELQQNNFETNTLRQFHIVNASDETVASIDSEGNARFNGVLYASDIQSDGLSRRFDLVYNALAELSASQSAIATSSGSLSTAIESAIEFLSEVLFRGPVRFLSNVFFDGNVSLKGQLTLPDNMAGSAIISQYTQSVDIVFDTPFATAPVVTISQVITNASDSAFLAEGFLAGVSNVTTNGFTISLDALAMRNYSYNWIAVVVGNKKQTVSSSPLMDILGLDTDLDATESGSPQASPSAETPTESTPSGGISL